MAWTGGEARWVKIGGLGNKRTGSWESKSPSFLRRPQHMMCVNGLTINGLAIDLVHVSMPILTSRLSSLLWRSEC